MKINKHHLWTLAACLALVSGCGNSNGVKLSLDFSKKPDWRYALSATVSGIISSADTQRTFSSAAQCTLSGKPDAKNPALLHASVVSVAVTSNILGDEEIRNLKEQAKTMRLSCALGDGAILPEDSSSVPVVKIGEWDLYKDLASTVPALPKIAVRPGAVWERERSLPLDTKQGSAVGHLFQSFCMDSLRKDKSGAEIASLSWKFVYRVEFRERDTLGLYAGVPTAGSGTGSAIVNVTAKTLEAASVHLAVPAAPQGKFRISWNENITLELVK
ncbi:MAG TPA: hypothetical protein VKF42_00035 [Chitinivibrionales bacterium]|jgi:hypothetical protein|nr:hypothetical protein [Chitinivibrionales bacterium]